MIVDPDDDTSYTPINEGLCNWKHCGLNPDKDRGIPNPKIYYLDAVFYACQFDSCQFSVHEQCFGGELKNVKLKRQVVEVKNEVSEEEKEVEEDNVMLESYLVENDRRRTPYDDYGK